MAPQPTPAPIARLQLDRRALGGTTGTYFDSTMSASPSATAAPAGTGSGVTGSSILNFALAVAAVAIIGSLLLWRIAKIKAGGLPFTPRAFFIPDGLRIKRLNINIPPCPPTQRHVEMMEAIRLAQVERANVAERGRGRRNRRTTTGPGIAEGGRRISEANLESDIVDEHGNEVGNDSEQLPGYDRHDKLPGYHQAWEETTPGTGHELRQVELPASTSQPSSPTVANEAAPVVESDQAYEARSRGQPQAAEAPTSAPADPPAYVHENAERT